MRRKSRRLPFVLVALAALGAESRGQPAVRARELRAGRAYELTALVWELRGVKTVSGGAVGFGRAKGEFFKLSEELLRLGGARDFERMLGDENVVVSAMGLVCLAQLGGERGRELLRLHAADARRIRVSEGCMTYDTTAGELARRLLAEPGFLGHGDRSAGAARAIHD